MSVSILLIITGSMLHTNGHVTVLVLFLGSEFVEPSSVIKIKLFAIDLAISSREFHAANSSFTFD